MNWLMNFTSIGKAWDDVTANAAEIGAAGLLLVGLGVMLSAAGALLGDVAHCPAISCAAALVENFKNNPHVGDFVRGLVTFKAGLMGLGLGRKLDAAAAASSSAAPAQAAKQ